jgi:CubicO group peptidase (beta-lactamase class C family)
MNRWSYAAISALWLIAASAPVVITAQDSKLQASIDNILSADTAGNQPGVAAHVKKDGKILFSKGYGVRKLGASEKIDSQTNFRLASFTKQFTAMGTMLLVHDGKLRYDESLTDVFPDFPSYGKQITIRNLLNHTSGLPDYEALMENAEKAKGPLWSPEHQIQDAEVFELLKGETAGKFAPGTSWAYSNSGYVVLGLVIAKASGSSYREFLSTRIFIPLHMDHTVVYQKGMNDVADRAYGNTKEGSSFKETDQSSTSATLGDGGIYSNLNDLSKWDDALRNHALLSAAEMQPALTPVKLADGSQPHWPVEPDDDNLAPGKPVEYGFGWFLDLYNGHARMWHTGSTMGFRSAIQRFTNGGLTIILLCNRTDLDTKKLSDQIAFVYLSERNKK